MSGIGIIYRSEDDQSPWGRLEVYASKPKLNASEFVVLAHKASRYKAVAGLVNQARILCVLFASPSAAGSTGTTTWRRGVFFHHVFYNHSVFDGPAHSFLTPYRPLTVCVTAGSKPCAPDKKYEHHGRCVMTAHHSGCSASVGHSPCNGISP